MNTLRWDSARESLAEYVNGSLHILQESLKRYQAGDTVFYRVVAVQLRLLLCDMTRRHDACEEISLLPALYPALKLRPLDESAQVRTDAERISIGAWLSQPIRLGDEEGITVRQFIRRICDMDGGAHADPKPEHAFTRNPQRQEIIARIAGALIDELPGGRPANA